jgi:DNA-binding response OmpR family regulator
MHASAFDLYIVEFWLADWAGVSLCRDIRKADPHVPICFCTAAAGPQDEARARRAGASSYIRKPVDPRILCARAWTLLDSAADRSESARGAARAAVQQELKKRLAALGPTVFSDQFANTLERISRHKAKQAFLDAGGTLASFEWTWVELWQEFFKNAASV